MSLPTLWTVAAASLSFMMAMLSWGFASAGLKGPRWFVLIALTAGAYSATNLVPLLGFSDAAVRTCGQAGLALIGLHIACWQPYVAAQNDEPMSRTSWAIVGISLVVSVLGLVPGVAFTQYVGHHTVAWAGATYSDAHLTPVGNVIAAVFLATLSELGVRYLLRWRRGVPNAGLHALGFFVLVLTGVSDAITANGLASAPILADLGFMSVLAATGVAMIQRFVDNARSLDELSNRLEQKVTERTLELTNTEAALMRAEKLGALGQLAAGVAHEINNPAVVILSNVDYLTKAYEEHRWPEDGLDCLNDVTKAANRISFIVDQLLTAGRVAGRHDSQSRSFVVATALALAVSTARQRVGAAVRIDIECPPDLHGSGESALVEQVVTNLVVNAGHAIALTDRPGHIWISVQRREDVLRLFVKDNGAGIAPPLQKRLFEPFFTTKEQGKGTGLGLAVSLGLLRSFGGDLWLESTSPQGTVMGAEFPAAQRECAREEAKKAARTERRLLLVDDETPVRNALQRMLGASFTLESCGGVEEALALLRERSDEFDAVLCDVTMPDGGGMRLCSELESFSPKLAQRVLLLTGGATSEETRAFLESMGPRVLMKPVTTQQVSDMVESVCAGQRLALTS